MKKFIALTTATAMLSGCANIGTINGVPVNQGTTVSTKNGQTYCEANPAICIIGAAVAVGVVGYLVNKSGSDGAGEGSDTF